MIPMLGLMIGAYIGFRMLEVIASADSRYSSRGNAITVKVLAGITFLVNAFGCVSLLMSGSQFPMPPH